MSESGYSRHGQAASKPGHVCNAAESGTIDKILRKLISGGQPLRQKPGDVKPGLYRARAFLSKKEAHKRCPFFSIFQS
jgi:hypothetical protein